MAIVFCCYNCLDLAWEFFFPSWVTCLLVKWTKFNSFQNICYALLSIRGDKNKKGLENKNLGKSVTKVKGKSNH